MVLCRSNLGGEMVRYQNKVSVVLLIVACIIFIFSFIGGLVFGPYNEWGFTLTYWFTGLAIGIFFVALAEIIEQLQKLNNKSPAENEMLDKKYITGHVDDQEDLTESDIREDVRIQNANDHVAWIIAISTLVIFFFLAIAGKQM